MSTIPASKPALRRLVAPRWFGASLLVVIMVAVVLFGAVLKVALGGYSVVPDAVLLIGFLLLAIFVATEATQPRTRLGRVSMILGVLLGLGGVGLQIHRLLVNSGLAAPSNNWSVTIVLIGLAVLFVATQVEARRRAGTLWTR